MLFQMTFVAYLFLWHDPKAILEMRECWTMSATLFVAISPDNEQWQRPPPTLVYTKINKQHEKKQYQSGGGPNVSVLVVLVAYCQLMINVWRDQYR